MLVIRKKYEDFNGVEREEDFHFNLTTAELARMELVHNGKLVAHLEEVIASKNGRRIIEVFEDLIHDAYGVKSEDGKSFLKTEEEWLKFKGSPAYSMIFMEIVTENGKAAEFVNGLMPADLQARVAEVNAKNGFRPGADTSRPTPPVAGQPTPPPSAPTHESVHEAPEQTQPYLATPPVQVSPELPPQQPQNPTVSPSEAPPAHPYDDPQRGDGGGYIGQ